MTTLLRTDGGSALVEFAMTAMFFFALTFAIVEASRAIYYYNIIASAAREGTRFAAVRGSESGREASDSDVEAYVVTRSVGLSPTINVTWSPPDKDPGSIVEVEVQHTFTSVVEFAGVPDVTMSSTARGIVLR